MGSVPWTSGEAARGRREGGYGAKRCAQEKRRGGGVRGESFSPASSSPYFSPALLLCAALYYLNAWIGYDYKQTSSYTGFPRTRLNKLKNSALVLQIAINTETCVITSTTILKSFYSIYIHLFKCPPQSHCQFHCPPLFSLQDGVTFISPVAVTEPLTTAPVLRKLVFT